MSDYLPSESDPLSQTIALLGTRVLAWRVIEAHAPWRLRFPSVDFAVFGQVIEGGGTVGLSGGHTFDIAAGDLLLMAAPAQWTMGAGDPAVTIDLKAAIADPACLRSSAPASDITRIIAGAFFFTEASAGLVAGVIPPVTHIRASEVAAGRLGRLLALVGDEALSDQPGRSLVLDRTLEIILVEALRHQPADRPDTGPGLLAGLRDPKIGAALRALHADIRHPWTVASLARRVGMSRSAFAARFTGAVGAAPIDYLSTWRMSLAKDALRGAKRPMSEIATLAGYQSVSAFSTAFTRAAGCPPTVYARGLP